MLAEQDQRLLLGEVSQKGLIPALLQAGAAAVEMVEQTPGKQVVADAGLAEPVVCEPLRPPHLHQRLAVAEDHGGELLPHQGGARHAASVVAEARVDAPVEREQSRQMIPGDRRPTCPAVFPFHAFELGKEPHRRRAHMRRVPAIGYVEPSAAPADDEPSLSVEPIVDDDPRGLRDRVPAGQDRGQHVVAQRPRWR